jgi:hypothetical protein
LGVRYEGSSGGDTESMRFENQTFTTDIAIDYNEFVNCTFKDCRILFHGGEFSFAGTVNFERVAFGLGHAANNTVTFLKFLRAAAPQAFAELMAQQQKPAASTGSTAPAAAVPTSSPGTPSDAAPTSSTR